VSATPRIKICGLTRSEDVDACLALGVEAVGLNFWPRSPRAVSAERAAELAERARGRARIVGVFVGAVEDELRRAMDTVGLDAVQLHGDEPDALLVSLSPRAYRAVRLSGPDDVARALRTPGDEVLVDAFRAGQPGGTGVVLDAELARAVTSRRRTWLAGGLTPANVAERIALTSPFGVDAASGVEASPGIKDPAAVERFVRAVRG
jgi:phosphoribosylanthranilate isomerase